MEENIGNIKISKKTLIQDLLTLGVKKGDLLYIKASMKSLGRVEGGANAFIDAVLDVVGKEGTIIVSSFVKVKPLSHLKRHKDIIYDINTASYAGAVGNAIMKYPDVELSRHPVQKFAAIGKLAKKLMGDHTENSYAYDPLRVMAEIGGKGLIVGKDVIGVGTTHVVMGLLGYKQRRPKVGVRYKDDSGKIKIFQLDWAGMCSDGFHKFFPEYDKVPGTIISKAKLGNADTKLIDMKKTMEIELKILGEDPHFFMCRDKDCFCCRLSWKFSTGRPLQFLLRNLFKFNRKNLKLFFRNYINGVWQPQEDRKDLLFMGKSYKVKR